MKEGSPIDQFETDEKDLTHTDFYYSETGELRQKLGLSGENSLQRKAWIGLIFCVLGGLIGFLIVRQCIAATKDLIQTYRKSPGIYKRTSYLRVKKAENIAYFGLWIF